MSKPAPVALFTYNRPDHTKATLEALSRNTLASETDLYVFSDGPKSDQDLPFVESVRDAVRSMSAFASVRLVERASNMGLANSIIAGVSELFETYDRVIVLEDDLVTTRHFLTFMNASLNFYESDPKAFSVTGYRLSESYLRIPGDFPFDTFAGYRCSSWSWGTWRDRWKRVDWDMTYFDDFIKDDVARSEFERGGRDLTEMLRHQHEGKIDSWAIRFSFAHYANDMRCMYPTKSLVRNIGLDNSGTHSKPNPRFAHPLLDDEWQPTRFSPADALNPVVASRFVNAFNGPISSKNPNRKRTIKRGMQKLAMRLRRLGGAPTKVKVLTVNTHQTKGGAARAAWRVFDGVRKIAPRSIYLTLFKEDTDPDVAGLSKRTLRGKLAQRYLRHQRREIEKYPKRQDTAFSPSMRPNPFRVPLGQFAPQVIHLNWVTSGAIDFSELALLKRPVVWTLHDTWAFTGGCHYTGDCREYGKLCGRCPQLGSAKTLDASRFMMEAKGEIFSKLNLTIVCPSRWMAEIAADSKLFGGRRIEVIPNGLDMHSFRPLDRRTARAHLNISDDECVVLFGAQSLHDPRKGGDLLIESLGKAQKDFTLLTFGDGTFSGELPRNVRLRSLGSVKADEDLARIYSSADVFVCASREDNLPNTVAEALACGTPCAAFNSGGLSDMIDHGECGWLARPFDTDDMAAGLLWLTTESRTEALRTAARRKAVTEYDINVVAARYVALFDDLID